MDGEISIIHSFSEGKISDPVFKQKCYKLTKKPCVMLFHYYDEFLKILRDHSKEADIQSTSTTRAHTSIVLYTCSTTGTACLQLSCTVHGRSHANSHRSAGVSLHDINTHACLHCAVFRRVVLRFIFYKTRSSMNLKQSKHRSYH